MTVSDDWRAVRCPAGLDSSLSADLADPLDQHEQVGSDAGERRPQPPVAAVLLVPVDLEPRIRWLALGFGAVAMAQPVGRVHGVELVSDGVDQQRFPVLAKVLNRIAQQLGGFAPAGFE